MLSIVVFDISSSFHQFKQTAVKTAGKLKLTKIQLLFFAEAMGIGSCNFIVYTFSCPNYADITNAFMASLKANESLQELTGLFNHVHSMIIGLSESNEAYRETMTLRSWIRY